MSDELYDVRNLLALGNFVQVIGEGANIKANPYKKKPENDAILLERDTLVAKAQIAMNQSDSVILDLESTQEPQLQAVLYLARYTKGDKAKSTEDKQAALKDANELWNNFEDSLSADAKAQVAITVGSLLIQAGELEPALKIVKKAQQATPAQPLLLELLALNVDILLRISQPDLAEKEVKHMQTIDDDATLTQLCSAWVCISFGGEKAIEAVQVAEELKEKFGPSVILLNLLALGHMAQCHFDQAEKYLTEAMAKTSGHSETLANLILCYQHLKKPVELINRYKTQLKTNSPEHPFVRELATMESKFERAAQQAATV
eukprot:TRINITY_DN104775_c0_g1_i1.p1 TRINITY_DN104775_c0_g1~~TRINITY_DN104775_c0_g1_i1.p1  ORF type:complete len:318 (-),score=40.84 TRINITY_DN104775_c0_g1_i1:113-1066(-)